MKRRGSWGAHDIGRAFANVDLILRYGGLAWLQQAVCGAKVFRGKSSVLALALVAAFSAGVVTLLGISLPQRWLPFPRQGSECRFSHHFVSVRPRRFIY
jgi:hypothetical protein